MTEALLNETCHDADQRGLVAALEEVRTLLRRHAARGPGERAPETSPVASRDGLHASNGTLSPPSALDLLCSRLALSPFERDVLLLCAGMELDGTFPGLCAEAQGSPHMSYPTFSLALAALPEAHWSALTPASPLRRWRLIETGGGDSLVRSPLRIDERVLHFLTGVGYLDESREALVRLIEAKLNGEVFQAAPVEEAKPTEDVLAGLMASVEAVKAARGR